MKIAGAILISGFLVAIILANCALGEARKREVDFLIYQSALTARIVAGSVSIARCEIARRRALYGEDDLGSYALEVRSGLLADVSPGDIHSLGRRDEPLVTAALAALHGFRWLCGSARVGDARERQAIARLLEGYALERNRAYAQASIALGPVQEAGWIDPTLKAAADVHQAFCRYMNGEADTAFRLFQKVIDVFPGSSGAVLSLKILDYLQAISARRAASAPTTGDMDELAHEAFACMDYRGALASATLALQGDPPNNVQMQDRFYRGRSREELGEFRDAQSEYEAVIRSDPNCLWARQANRRLCMLGEVYLKDTSIMNNVSRQFEACHDQEFVDTLQQALGRVLSGRQVQVAVNPLPMEVPR